VLRVAYTRVSLLGNGTVALASMQVPRRLPEHALGVSCVHRVSFAPAPRRKDHIDANHLLVGSTDQSTKTCPLPLPCIGWSIGQTLCSTLHEILVHYFPAKLAPLKLGPPMREAQHSALDLAVHHPK
jgi:hypothetical protein